uniref:2',3'-cyclic-nucleotide 2'-phosphodiesterase/5'-or 3'-nucleotidase, 5'-nucleotidase family n=1 Tax=Candidatus Kentrum sp. FW TaxID=2126338 RepID=A0A450U3C5_9GAMM|nr:MAG: 2',3'-cyclic-nucleotide 2'-phosphodiesterase/5'-or 3'-nucleotidase, 5'-nucleotidase family [Candidatus Kentron sp. FW]
MPFIRKRTGFYLIPILLSVLFSSPLIAGDGPITLIHMGDIHGHLVPRPHFRTGDPDYGKHVGGLAYLYDQIKKIRAQYPDALLINTGDTIQGSAEALYSKGQVIVDILNRFEIDAFVPGNWDFLYGTERFRELFAGDNPKANWHALAANLYYSTLYDFPLSRYPDKAGQRVLPFYLVKEVGEVKVGILGLTADRGPQAVSPRTMDGFFLTPGKEELEAAVPLLRGEIGVDLLVLISERGLAANLELVEAIPGVDIVLSSDMHEETWQVLQAKTGTLLVEEGQDGTMLGELHLTVKDRAIADWRWIPHRISTENNRPDPEVAKQIKEIRTRFVKGHGFVPHVNPLNTSVLRTPIDTTIGFTKVPLHRSDFSDTKEGMPAVIEGSSHDFLADAFRDACRGDVGVMRGFRYGTHIGPGAIKLEDIYHFIPTGPQIACGEISGDALYLAIERSADRVLSPWVGWWGGGWLTGFSGITYDLDPYNEYRLRSSNIRINGEVIDPERMYLVGGYWNLDDPDKINRMPALQVKTIRDADGGTIDATHVVAWYLQSLPHKTVNPEPNRVKLLRPLPKPIWKNREIQPLRGVDNRLPKPDRTRKKP